ncbi:unnamed protein product [Rotaria sp. Silwood1]|nr:unnamed protein product [Rotaria sp. Silwood1]CAF1459687.1 unnamed protein product [Rotaria sp. Silwood1]
MEDKSNSTTDNVSLNNNINNDDIHENLSSPYHYIDFIQSNNDDDDDEKTSEPIAEQADDSELNVNHTTTDNNQQQIKKKKHIMISYNHASASDIAQKIYDRLTVKRGTKRWPVCIFYGMIDIAAINALIVWKVKNPQWNQNTNHKRRLFLEELGLALERHYNVWFDKKDLHGSVLDSMGEAVENSYVVLLCITDGYSKSAFCTKEAKYAVERKIPVIPCMVEKTFRPSGGLGIIKSDLKHIELFDEDKFDEKFEELIDEINAIEIGLGIKSAAPIMDMDFRDHFNAFISDHIESIRNCYLRRENLTESEFGTILYKLIQAFSPETLESFQNDQSSSVDTRQLETNDNDCLIQHLLENDKKLAELVRIQEEIYARNQQYLLQYDERIAAFIRFQEQTNTNFMQQQINQNERLSSLIHVQEEQQPNYAYLQQQLFNQNQPSIQLEQRQQEQEKNDQMTKRILFIGPTGSGKSTLINGLFNDDVKKESLLIPAITNDTSSRVTSVFTTYYDFPTYAYTDS